VQSFIEQARKAQDLYAGSRILSELAKAAAMEAGVQGIKLIFPQQAEDALSFPNRFTGILPDSFSKEELQAKGKAVEEKAKELFKAFAEEALKKADYENNAPEGFRQQIENHLDINWLFLPYDVADPEGYKKAFMKSDALMAALKNTRFISNPHPEDGRKCNLDGEHNALFRGPDTTNSILLAQAVEIDGRTTGVWLAPNEGLSAVSLLKRAYKEKQAKKNGFPSTAKVALSKQLDDLNPEKKFILNCYERLFSKDDYPKACVDLMSEDIIEKIHFEFKNDNWCTNFDEEFLYEENLTDKNKSIPNPTQLDIAKKVQQKLKPHLTHKYYALICFDVDKMGELLGRSDADSQKKISEKLMVFSGSIYENPDLKNLHVVYAGGDDFLGFVNLEDLFEVVKTLRKEFDKQISKALGEDITFSMGIAIAHYKTPLHIVLQTARAMQKNAKAEDKGDRNAVAIKVLKHSGEGHETYFNWNLKGEVLPKWDALQQLTEHLLEDCSDTFIRSLEREFSSLQKEDGILKNQEDFREEKEDIQGQLITVKKPVAMLQAELLRLAHRSLKEGKKDKADELRNLVWTFFVEEDKTMHKEVVFENALEALKTAIFIHRKTKAKTK